MQKTTFSPSNLNDKLGRLEREAKARQLSTGLSQNPGAGETMLTADTKRSGAQGSSDAVDAAATSRRKAPVSVSKSSIQLRSGQHYGQMVHSHSEHPLVPMKAQHHLPQQQPGARRNTPKTRSRVSANNSSTFLTSHE